MDTVTDIQHQPVQGTKGGELKALLYEVFHRQINQVGRITHGIGRVLDRCGDNGLAAFPTGRDLQVGPDELAIAVQGLLRFDRFVH